MDLDEEEDYMRPLNMIVTICDVIWLAFCALVVLGVVAFVYKAM